VIINLLVKPLPGTYALILQNHCRVELKVGRLGKICFVPGHYIYVGSARGPGGIRARVSRHCRTSKPIRWHIDYLSTIMRPVCAWIHYDSKHLEHRWARIVSKMRDIAAIKGFGSSDCNCPTHMFYSAAMPDFDGFNRLAGGGIEQSKLTSVR
jgi:Uri superfamily endonuclease